MVYIHIKEIGIEFEKYSLSPNMLSKKFEKLAFQTKPAKMTHFVPYFCIETFSASPFLTLEVQEKKVLLSLIVFRPYPIRKCDCKWWYLNILVYTTSP